MFVRKYLPRVPDPSRRHWHGNEPDLVPSQADTVSRPLQLVAAEALRGRSRFSWRRRATRRAQCSGTIAEELPQLADALTSLNLTGGASTEIDPWYRMRRRPWCDKTRITKPAQGAGDLPRLSGVAGNSARVNAARQRERVSAHLNGARSGPMPVPSPSTTTRQEPGAFEAIPFRSVATRTSSLLTAADRST